VILCGFECCQEALAERRSNKKSHSRVGTERPQAQAQQNSRYPTMQTRDRKNCFLDHLVPSRQSLAKEEHKIGRLPFVKMTTSKGTRNTYQRTSRLSPQYPFLYSKHRPQ